MRLLDSRFDLEAFFSALRRAPRSLLLLDYDGTLAPFTAARAAATPYPGVGERLAAIRDCPGCRVVVVSGRRAAEAQRLLGLEPPLETWGAHGLERLLPGGSRQIEPVAEEVLAALAAAGDRLEAAGWTAQLEEKPGCLAVHWRGLTAEAAAALQRDFERHARAPAVAAGLAVEPFAGGIELRDRRCDKGRAVARLLAGMPDGTPAAFLGDDGTDEGAFTALPLSALSVLVAERPRPTAARAWLKPPEELLQFLDRWLAEARRETSTPPERATPQAQPRLVVVSNRLPVTLQRTRTGEWVLRRGSGGLITALEPILDRRGGVWIGWPGVTAEELADPGPRLAGRAAERGYRLRPVVLTAAQYESYYLGFSNEILWPLFHDLQSRCTFVPDYWAAYREVNREFARVVGEEAAPGDLVWVHDYHLMPVGAELRTRHPQMLLCFFLHIPFPPPDIFAKLPWRREFLEFLLAYDLVGFQTTNDRRNFVGGLRRFLPDAVVRGRGRDQRIRRGGRSTWPAVHPIGIDARDFAATAATPAVAEAAQKLRADLQGAHIVLGVDRLDYTKGIPFRLEAMRLLLRERRELRRRICLVQIVVPSREKIPEYQRLKLELEQLVGEINGQLAEPGWVPIHYLHRSLRREQLVAYYRAADTCLATSLKDGMNLVAKEYCVCKCDRQGVLILSEFAGAAAQLDSGALLVNPYDIAGLAARLGEAFDMPPRARQARMARLQREVLREDVYWWVNRFVRDGLAMTHDRERTAAA